MRIVLCNVTRFGGWRMPPEVAENVRRRFPELDVVHVTDRSQLAAALATAEVYAGSYLSPDELAAAGRLRWIHSTASGVDHFPLGEIAGRAIAMTNARTVHAPPMAEHAIAMILALLRRLPEARDHQRERRWAQEEIWQSAPPPRTLAGAIVLLIGLGEVGREIARRLAPFGATLEAVTRSGSAPPGIVARCCGPDELLPAVARADVIVVAAPATPATSHLVGARVLAAMKRDAVLVNLSRGSLVDEGALVAALTEERIAGAALDVTEVEPLPPESPLWEFPTLLLTPHLSAMSPDIWPRQTELILGSLERFLSGRKPLNPVDLGLGY